MNRRGYYCTGQYASCNCNPKIRLKWQRICVQKRKFGWDFSKFSSGPNLSSDSLTFDANVNRFGSISNRIRGDTSNVELGVIVTRFLIEDNPCNIPISLLASFEYFSPTFRHSLNRLDQFPAYQDKYKQMKLYTLSWILT